MKISLNEKEKRFPSISVIIPMYNESEKISRCLESVKSLDYPSEKIEIIVVDDGSTDNSVKVALEYDITLIEGIHGGPSLARNKGVDLSSFKIIAFLDADDKAHPSWLKTSITLFKDRTVAAVGSCKGLLNPIKNFSKINWIYHLHRYENSLGETDHLGTSGLVCKKDIFLECDGFDPNMLAGEDMYLSYKISSKNYKLIRLKESLISIELPESPIDYMRNQIKKSAYTIVFIMKKTRLKSKFVNDYIGMKESINSLFPILSILIFILLPSFELISLLLQGTLFFLFIGLNSSFIKKSILFARKEKNLNYSWVINLLFYILLRSISWSLGLIYGILITTRSFLDKTL